MKLVLSQRFEFEFLETIFPVVENWLGSSSDHQNALRYVSSKKLATMERYRSSIDYLFCEVHLEHKKACFLFYDDEGPQLREFLGEEARARLERGMMHALELAYAAFCEQRRLSWVQFRLAALRAA